MPRFLFWKSEVSELPFLSDGSTPTIVTEAQLPCGVVRILRHVQDYLATVIFVLKDRYRHDFFLSAVQKLVG